MRYSVYGIIPCVCEPKKLLFQIPTNAKHIGIFFSIGDSLKCISIFSAPIKNFSKLLLKIYDCQGRQILDILDENFQSEPNSIKLDVERLKTGTYFINLQSDDQSATHCFIKE